MPDPTMPPNERPGAVLSSSGPVPQSELSLDGKPVYNVLAVDDCNDDRVLLKRAFRSATRLRLVQTLDGGQELTRYLRGEAAYADRELCPLPDLLLLDIKMEGMDGFDVLRWLQSEPLPKRPVVVVLSHSDFPSDISKAISLGADYYQCKPYDFEPTKRLVQVLEGFMVRRHR